MSAERVGTGLRRESREACAWVVRGEPGGGESAGGKSLVDYNLNNDVVTLGWGDWVVDAPVAAFKDWEMLNKSTEQWSEHNWKPNWKESHKRTATKSIWQFCNDIHVGDIVVLPPKGQKWIAVGEVTGPAERNEGRPAGARLYRPVKWLVTGKPYQVLTGDIRRSISSQGTIFRIGGAVLSRRISFRRELQALV